MARLTGKNGKIQAEATRTTISVAVTLTNAGDNLTYTYTGFPLWDPSKVPVITKNAVVVDPSLYTVNFISGSITFAVANLVTDVIKANVFDYVTVADVADIFDWTVDAKVDVVDVTAFQDQFHQKLSAFRGWTGTAKAYHRSDFWFPLFNAAKPVYVKLYPDAAAVEYFVGAGFVSFAEKAPYAGAVEDDVAIEGTGALERRTS